MGSRVTRVMSFPPPNFQLPTPFHSRLRVGVDTDRQTDHHCIMPPLHGDISNNITKIFRLNAEISMCHFDAPTVQNTGGRHNMPPPSQVDLWPFDLESGVRVTCDVAYLCANFSLPTPRPLCSRLRPDIRDRQTSDIRRASSLNASSLWGA